MSSDMTYQHLITEGIKGLPQDLLAEITDFVYFVRRRAIQPKDFEDEIFSALMKMDLDKLNWNELAHLEEEFVNYEQRYPTA